MAPGESGKIPVKISTNHASGQISKSITVNTNVPGAEGTITLQFKGEVWQAVQVTPPSAAFGRIGAADAEKGAMRKLTIVNNVEGELKLSTPTSTNPKFKAEITPLEDGKKYELTVTLVPPLVNGNNTGKIEITTGLAEMPKIDVAVYAFLTAAVDVTPSTLSIPSTRNGVTSRQLYIRNNNNKPIKITELTSTNPLIKTELTDVKDGTTYRLKVDFPADYTAPAGKADQITFKTDEPSVPVITIPVTIMPTPARPMPQRQMPMKRSVSPMKTDSAKAGQAAGATGEDSTAKKPAAVTPPGAPSRPQPKAAKDEKSGSVP